MLLLLRMEPSKEETSEPMNAEYRLAQEENTDGKNEMSVTEQQVKAMMMEAKRLAERCRCDMEASNANCEELKSSLPLLAASLGNFVFDLF